MKENVSTVLCTVKGLVQGVGFRPFVYRTAVELHLTGTVENRTDGVRIIIQGNSSNIEEFIQKLNTSPPPASVIETVDTCNLGETQQSVSDPHDFESFTILKSEKNNGKITEVSPDIAVCDNCLEDLEKQESRINFPFINCTNCGPRFTIIKSLPYDRQQTTMGPFKMCSRCEAEYNSPLDRRFHAQPVSCNECGPEYTLHTENTVISNITAVLETAAELIDSGKIIAVKGLGGFHLVCNALDKKAAEDLRKLKKRETKPFAVMTRDIKTAEKYVYFDKTGSELLQSWRRPIVLADDKAILPSDINRGLSRTGIILPYMPFHYMLFQKLETDCIIATSGNFSDEPIIIDNSEALAEFLPVTSAVIIYNREIYNRCDDSVAFTSGDKIRLIRRSRGWTPASIKLEQSCDGILAVGGELKNTFCIGKDNKAFLSQHIGDLKSCETEIFFKESVKRFSTLFNVNIKKIACDLHPDYISTGYALESGLPVMGVQHHWAHIASCLAEYGINRKVAGFAFDGTGYGTDGAVWGGEVLICDLHDFERYTHLDYIPLPGGDAGVKEPWRMGISYLYRVFGESFRELDLPILKKIREKEIEIVTAMIKNGINSPPTSSMGRLFDAVSAITGICLYSGFEAEAAMRLESLADSGFGKDVQSSEIRGLGEFDYKSGSSKCYSYQVNEKIIIYPMIKEIVNDLINDIPPSSVSIKFHNTIAEIILSSAEKIRRERGIRTAALSGGVFYNKMLLSLAEKKLKRAGFEVLTNCKVPSGDGGISFGQCAIAAEFFNTKLKYSIL